MTRADQLANLNVVIFGKKLGHDGVGAETLIIDGTASKLKLWLPLFIQILCAIILVDVVVI